MSKKGNVSWNDLDVRNLQIIRDKKTNYLYYVQAKKITFLHSHKAVILRRLSRFLQFDWTKKIVLKENWNDEDWELISNTPRENEGHY